MCADSLHALNPGLIYSLLRGPDQIVHQPVEHAFQGLVELQLLGSLRVKLSDFAIEALENLNAFPNLFQRQQVRFVSVIQIGGVVGDFIREVDELSFQRRALVQKILRQFRMLLRIVIVRMLDDSFAHFERQVQAAKRGVALLKVFHNAQRMKVVVEEKSMLVHRGVESFFSGMSERRMADVMYQRESFGKVSVEPECSGNGARNLGHFEGMCQTIAEVVRVAAREDLGLGLKPAKSAGVYHTIAVALEIVAVGMRRLSEAPSAGLRHLHRVSRQHEGSLPKYRVPGTEQRNQLNANYQLLVTAGS